MNPRQTTSYLEPVDNPYEIIKDSDLNKQREVPANAGIQQMSGHDQSPYLDLVNDSAIGYEIATRNMPINPSNTYNTLNTVP